VLDSCNLLYSINACKMAPRLGWTLLRRWFICRFRSRAQSPYGHTAFFVIRPHRSKLLSQTIHTNVLIGSLRRFWPCFLFLSFIQTVLLHTRFASLQHRDSNISPHMEQVTRILGSRWDLFISTPVHRDEIQTHDITMIHQIRRPRGAFSHISIVRRRIFY